MTQMNFLLTEHHINIKMEYKMIEREMLPWVEFLIRIKMKWLIIPIGFIFAFFGSIFYAIKDAYNSFTESMKYSIDDIKEIIQYLKNK